MRLSVVVSDGHAAGVDPRAAHAADRELVAAVRDAGLDGITFRHAWATAPLWNLQPMAAAAYLAAAAEGLSVAVHALPLSVLNPVEVAEALATVDHAWGGRSSAGLSLGSPLAFAVYGIDPQVREARFAQALDVVRKMWTVERLTGTGPHFTFSEVRPTLRPVQPDGPPLSLAVDAIEAAETAARLGLDAHIEPWVSTDEVERLARTYREAGGDRLSLERGAPTEGDPDGARGLLETIATVQRVGSDVEVPPGPDVLLPSRPAALAEELERLEGLGFSHLHLRVRHPGTEHAAALAAVGSAGSARATASAG